jgi:hypothetical protein
MAVKRSTRCGRVLFAKRSDVEVIDIEHDPAVLAVRCRECGAQGPAFNERGSSELGRYATNVLPYDSIDALKDL